MKAPLTFKYHTSTILNFGFNVPHLHLNDGHHHTKTRGSIIQKKDLIEISLSKTSAVEMNVYRTPSA